MFLRHQVSSSDGSACRIWGFIAVAFIYPRSLSQLHVVEATKKSNAFVLLSSFQSETRGWKTDGGVTFSALAPNPSACSRLALDLDGGDVQCLV